MDKADGSLARPTIATASPHRVGDQAAAAVALVWSSIGAAVEHVQQDYGDDLLVQPSLSKAMSPSRIWVQVKGTGAKNLGPRKVYVRNQQLLRWARTADMTVTVSWNTVHSAGFYAEIPEGLDLVGLMDSSLERTGIAFSEENRFDAEHAEMLARTAYARHVNNELLLQVAW